MGAGCEITGISPHVEKALLGKMKLYGLFAPEPFRVMNGPSQYAGTDIFYIEFGKRLFLPRYLLEINDFSVQFQYGIIFSLDDHTSGNDLRPGRSHEIPEIDVSLVIAGFQGARINGKDYILLFAHRQGKVFCPARKPFFLDGYASQVR